MTTSESWTLRKLETVAEKHKFSLKTRIGDLPENIFDLIFWGKNAREYYTVEYINKSGKKVSYPTQFEGVIPHLERRYRETTSEYSRVEIDKYMREIICSSCNGKRLKPTSLAVRIDGKNISEVYDMTISDFITWIPTLSFNEHDRTIAKPILREITTRANFLTNVGLEYLTFSRKATTLSGGEAQRIRLASQIGTGLTGVLYVLDEPSIGLHSRDIQRLLNTLTGLRDLGNTVIIVEHDEETIRAADWIIDMGPGAGEKGGHVVSEGTPDDIIHDPKSLTGKYLSHTLNTIPSTAPRTSSIGSLKIYGAAAHNLKKITAEFPLGKLITITGVSGSGKSTLINDTLYKILLNEIQNGRQIPGKFDTIDGLEHVTKVVNIDQSPIGRTPRSNPATYTGVFTPIRELFSQTQESRARGYKPGRFSFNVKGGRCETCKGDGQIKIEMQFLPDMYVRCDECKGKRYNREVLQVDFKEKNVDDVLSMSVSEAIDFFGSFTSITRKLSTLRDVGLDYIRLGQPAPTLSGGEAQRIKLSSELSKIPRGHTVYILDEPTTGLHFDDVKKLISVLHKLVDKGHTVIIIEHNLEVVRTSDWIIDLGPEGGDKGGSIVATGTVDDIIASKDSYTGRALKQKRQ